MRAREEEFITVALFDADEVADGTAAIAVTRLMRAAKPDNWMLLPLTGFLAFFRTKRGGRERAATLIGKMESLIASDSALRSWRVGASEGLAVAEFDWLGRMRSPAFGDIVNLAIRRADAGLRSARDRPDDRVGDLE